LQQVFYRLYDQWIKKKQIWTAMQVDKQTELRAKYPDTQADNNEKYQDEYLNWYQIVAESYLEGLNEQMGKILGVFSPNDMKIIEGILDSGSGAELEEAREILNNARKRNPDGGYVYPVTLYPEDWFELLDNSFSAVDLLATPAALSQQLSTLEVQRLNIITRITQLAATIPNDDSVKNARDAVTNAQAELDSRAQDLVGTYGEGARLVFNTALSIGPIFGAGNLPSMVVSRLMSDNGVTNTTTSDFTKALTDKLENGFEKQTELIKGAEALTDAMMKSNALDTLALLKSSLGPLKSRLEDLNHEILELQAQMKQAQAIHVAPNIKTTKDNKDVEVDVVNINAKEAITPNELPKGFMQIIMEVDASSMESATEKSTQASQSTCGANFFFCGGSYHSSNSASAYDSFTKDKGCKLQIGMSVAKVSIDRAWFNPGLFLLSRDMCSVTTQNFAPSDDYSAGYTVDKNVSKDTVDTRFKAMNSCVFPCFPTAFVIARDVTIKLVTTNSFHDEHARAVESHVSSGGGFLFFSGNSSSSSASSSCAVSAQSSENSITIRFADPQVIGYYLEATPPDKSVYLDEVSKDPKGKEVGYVTIMDFVQKCREMLDEYNKSLSGPKH
jgi:hypothetical protein